MTNKIVLSNWVECIQRVLFCLVFGGFLMQSHGFFLLLMVMCEGGYWSPPDGPEIALLSISYYPDLYYLKQT